MTNQSRPCQWCGNKTFSPRGTCRDCAGIEKRANLAPEPKHALQGGAWRPNRRGVLVWDGPRPAEDPTRPRAQCGTDSGYHHHLKRSKTKACDPCKAANREAEQQRAAA